MNWELFELSLQSLRRKKRSSLLLFAVLFLSFAFAIVSLTVTGSIQKTNQEYRYDVYGEWYGALTDMWANDETNDGEFLREQEWIRELGVSQKCGTILTSKVVGSGTGVGVVDEDFLKIGRVGLKEGRFPEAPNEIAVEADLLGYEYTLGQEVSFVISFPVIKFSKDRFTQVEYTTPQTVSTRVEFTLCGILQEYTDQWTKFDFPTPSLTTPLLNGALVSPAGMERIIREEDAAAERRFVSESNRVSAMYQKGEPEKVLAVELNDPISTQYIFSVQPDMEETALEEMKNYLASTERSVSVNFTVNTPILTEDEQEVVNVYTWMVLGITLLAVVCIYTIRMQDEARQLAIFRSIGVTRRQLCIMLLYETLLLGAPAMILGTGAGALGTWAILKATLYAGSASVYVVVPPVLLAITAALWILGVLIARLAVFVVALRAPLTGRFHVARKKARRYTNLRRCMIVGLSALLCTTLIFTAVESVEPLETIRSLGGTYDFVVSKSDFIGWHNDPDVITALAKPTTIYDTSYTYKNALLHTDYKDAVAEIPGVGKVYGWGQQYVRLEFDGRENAALLQTSMANYNATNRDLAIEYGKMLLDPAQVRFPPGIGPYDPFNLTEVAFTFLFMVDEGDWENYIDFDTVDREKFRSGEQVLLSFCQNENGKFEPDYTYTPPEAEFENETEFEESDIGISVGDTVSIIAGASTSSYGAVETEVGGIIIYPPDFISEIEQLNHQYTVICSGAFVEKLMGAMGENAMWNIYRENKPYGYRHLFVYVDSSTDYLDTDTALTEFCTREKLFLNTEIRSWKQATKQQSGQKLILLFSGGGCVVLVLLLILWNALSMEAERMKRSIGIQQALGMSRKQTSRRQFGIAALRGVLGVALGWLVYGGYWNIFRLSGESGVEENLSGISVWVSEQKQGLEDSLARNAWNWTNWLAILLLTALCVALILGVSHFANRRLTREDLMAKLRDEH